MADRGLHAYVVPSARAGQTTDPTARRDALAGLFNGGFLLSIIALAIAIVVAAPQYAEPAVEAAPLPALAAASPGASDGPGEAVFVPPTSKPPSKLKGYRWPVYGGQIDTYFAFGNTGGFQIGSQRLHDGLVITWDLGVKVHAAHSGTVVAAGQDWLQYVGYYDPVDAVYSRYAPITTKASAQPTVAKAGNGSGRKKAATGKPAAASASGGRKASRKPAFPSGIVIDDGNGYRSVYTEITDLQVSVGQKVKVGQRIGFMSRAEGKRMMRYRLVRMDGRPMRVYQSDRHRGYPTYARQRIDPLAVFKADAKRRPRDTARRPSDADRPWLADY